MHARTHTHARGKDSGSEDSFSFDWYLLRLPLPPPLPPLPSLTSPGQLSERILRELSLSLTHAHAFARTLTRTGAHIGGSRQRGCQWTAERAPDRLVNLSASSPPSPSLSGSFSRSDTSEHRVKKRLLQTASDWSSSTVLLRRLRIFILDRFQWIPRVRTASRRQTKSTDTKVCGYLRYSWEIKASVRVSVRLICLPSLRLNCTGQTWKEQQPPPAHQWGKRCDCLCSHITQLLCQYSRVRSKNPNYRPFLGKRTISRWAYSTWTWNWPPKIMNFWMWRRSFGPCMQLCHLQLVAGRISPSATTRLDDFTLCSVRLQPPDARTHAHNTGPYGAHEYYIKLTFLPLHFTLLLLPLFLSLPLLFPLLLWPHLTLFWKMPVSHLWLWAGAALDNFGTWGQRLRCLWKREALCRMRIKSLNVGIWININK